MPSAWPVAGDRAPLILAYRLRIVLRSDDVCRHRIFAEPTFNFVAQSKGETQTFAPRREGCTE